MFKVKSEINEFIDCNPTESVDDEEEEELFNPQCVIKSETEQQDYLLEIDDKSWNLSTEPGTERIRQL